MAPLLLILCLLLPALPAQAVIDLWWDGGTVDISGNGDGASAGGDGNWDQTTKNWDATSGNPHVAWSANRSPEFGGTAGTVTIAAPITFECNEMTFTTPGYTIVGSYGISLSTGAASKIHVNQDATISAALVGGTGPLTVDTTGSGVLTLSGANTFDSLTLNPGATIAIATFHNASTAGPLGDGSPTTIGGTLKYTGSTVTSSKTLVMVAGGAGTLQIANSTANLTLSGVISGSGGLNKTGPGTLTLIAKNTFTGAVNVDGGVLSIDSAIRLNNSATEPITLSSGGTLRNTGSGGDFLPANRPLVIGTGGGTIEVSASADTAQYTDNLISGAGNTLTKAGGGEFRTYSAHNLFGKLIVSGGMFTIGGGSSSGYADSVGAIPTSTTPDAITLGAGTTLRLLNNNADVTFDLNQGITLTGAATIRVNRSSRTLTIPGVIAGNCGLTFGASGDVGTNVLSGANTYSGTTTVSYGTLALIGSGSIAYSPTISVASGATFDVSGMNGGSYSLANGQTLKGNGSLNGDLIVASGAAVEPGTSIGTLTFSSDNLTFSAGSTLRVEVNRSPSPTADKIQGIATLTSGGTLEVINIGAALEVNDSFTLLSASTRSGEFGAISPANPNSDPELAWDKPALKGSGVLKVHHVPYATNQTVVRAQGTTAKIKLSELFPSLDPLDADTVVLESFTAGSQGAMISSNATYLFYVPANDNDDAFDYTVVDSRGEKRTRTITVSVQPVTGQAQRITVVDGRATVHFAGIPGLSYDVERAEDIDFTVNRTKVLSISLPSDGDGLFTYVDNNPPDSQAYYRLKYPGTAP